MKIKVLLSKNWRISVYSLLILMTGCSFTPSNLPPPEPITPVRSQPAPQAKPRPAPTKAQPIAVVPSHPSSYTVVKGDTLWDIAARFLRDPWVWPQIWDVNPQIENPHLIYPGDIISLVWVDGQPRLVVDRPGAPRPTTGQVAPTTPIVRDRSALRLQPRIRVEKLSSAIPTISSNAIRQFSVKPLILTEDELDAAPYVISNVDQHLISATGNAIYVRGIPDNAESLFSLYRPHLEFIDPITDESLGYEVIYVGDARVSRYGDPASLIVGEINREVLNGDILLPLDRGKIAHDYIPRMPEQKFDGRVLTLFDAISQSGQNQTIAINIGQRDGLEIGDILAIERTQGRITDRYGSKRARVQLPQERSGIIMVVRIFDRVSYGLIMKSTHPIHVNDLVVNP